MKNTTYFLLAIFGLIVMSCSTTSTMTSYEDDIYYSPSDAPVVEQTQVSTTPIGDDLYYADSETKSNGTGEYYDPDWKKGEYGEYQRESNNYYDEDDFYYSSRIRRFHRPFGGFGYYDPFYTSYWSPRAYFYRPNFWHPYHFQPGFNFSMGFGYSNFWNTAPGWNTGAFYGYDPFGYSPFGFNSFGYNPYGFGYSAYSPYGFCPSNGFGGGFAFASDGGGSSVYRGQYTPITGQTAPGASSINARTKDLNPTMAGPTARTVENSGRTAPRTESELMAIPDYRTGRPVSTTANERGTSSDRPNTPYVREEPRTAPVDNSPRRHNETIRTNRSTNSGTMRTNPAPRQPARTAPRTNTRSSSPSRGTMNRSSGSSRSSGRSTTNPPSRNRR